MSFPFFSHVILLDDILDTNLVAGDMETIVEYHPATNEYPEGYAVEFFAGSRKMLAVVSVAASVLRQVTRNDLLHVRQVVAA